MQTAEAVIQASSWLVRSVRTRTETSIAPSVVNNVIVPSNDPQSKTPKTATFIQELLAVRCKSTG